VSLSDTQAVTTLALLISAYYFVGCTISAYHYDLVCTLVLMSSAAYIGSMIAIHMYFDTTWWLILFRAAMIVVNFVLAFRLFRRRSAIFPSSIPLSNIKSINRSFNTGLVLPATCFIDHPGVSNASNLHNFTASLSWTTNTTSPTSFNISSIHGNYNNSAPLTNATMPNFTLFASDDDTRSIGDQVALGLLSLAFILGALSSLFLFLSKRNQNPSGRSTVPATARSERQNHSPPGRQKFAFVLRCVSFIIANGVAFYGFVCFYKLWNWMNESRWFADGDDEKNVKSFGQLMPVLLLLLPILALMEQCAGEFVPFLPCRNLLFPYSQSFHLHVGPFSHRQKLIRYPAPDKDSSTHKNKIQKNETMSEA
jgi:hypothetical protein